jgi:hypothetical protein
MQRKYDTGKKFSHDLRPGDIVFVKNFSQAKPGQNYKLRVFLHKSPYQVLTVASRTALVKRLVDGHLIQVHTDFLRKYSPSLAQRMHLPEEVVAIVGKGLSEEALLDLARVDKLELLHRDRPNEAELAPAGALTRSASRKLREQATVEVAQPDPTWTDLAETDDEVCESDPFWLDPSRRVRFADEENTAV